MNKQEEKFCGDCTKCKVGLKVGTSPKYCIANYGTEYQIVIRLTNDDESNPKGVFLNDKYDEEVVKLMATVGNVQKRRYASI